MKITGKILDFSIYYIYICVCERIHGNIYVKTHFNHIQINIQDHIHDDRCR